MASNEERLAILKSVAQYYQVWTPPKDKGDLTFLMALKSEIKRLEDIIND